MIHHLHVVYIIHAENQAQIFFRLLDINSFAQKVIKCTTFDKPQDYCLAWKSHCWCTIPEYHLYFIVQFYCTRINKTDKIQSTLCGSSIAPSAKASG